MRPAVITQKLGEDIAAGCEMFMDFPVRWLEKPQWRCEKGHVSKAYLKTDDGERCLQCFGPVWLTFPEDKEEAP